MDFSLSSMWASMGLFARLIAVTLGVMSVASLSVMVERLLAFAKSARTSRDYAQALSAALGKDDWKAANGADGDAGGHLGRVLGSGLKAFERSGGAGELAVESVARAIERTSQREVATLKRGLGVLATVASTAPFVGLLGTVTGIINSFQLMGKGGGAGLGVVSAGIAEALVTTAFGLLVAIPAVMGFNILNGKVDAFAVDIAEAGNELLDHVSRAASKKKAG